MRPLARALSIAALLLLAARGEAADAGPAAAAYEEGETLSGGAATSIAPPGREAFRQMSGNLPEADAMRFHLGRALFRKLWVAAPSSTQASDGLGPLFNARSCESCHVRDGRGRSPEPGESGTGFLLRLARNPQTAQERQMVATGSVPNFPDPVYGTQLQDRAIPGLAAEGQVAIAREDRAETLYDGTVVRLSRPSYAVAEPAYGALAAGTVLSPRIAPPMIGLGLIEAIPDADILAHADPGDRDGDGISGRPALAVAGETGIRPLGRFGWKGQHATVAAQTAAALAHDIGIASPAADLPFGDCTGAQTDCLSRPTGVQPRLGPQEISAEAFDALVFYAANLAVPARRKASFQAVLAGKAVFRELGCAACHVPAFTTGADATIPALGGQRIWPYSDFLLHDMGEGLADGQTVGEASSTEWRTPPLWGLGLAGTVNGNRVYLHDGRARSLAEAILWHGGEAEAARERFRRATAEDRQSLIRFLESL